MPTAANWRDFPRYPIVAGTASLAVATTLAWWAHFNVSALLEGPHTQRGELWRLFTSIFLHTDILHLIFNVYWLWVFGCRIENVFGHARTAFILVFLAVGSGAFQFALDQGGVGLSGVGYGLFGMLWVLSRHDPRFHAAIQSNTTSLFVGWFFFCIVLTVAKIYPVANVAHATGAILGAFLGFAISFPRWRVLTGIGFGALMLGGIWACTLGRPLVNVSHAAGYDEASLGYEALVKNDNAGAIRWFKDASRMQPEVAMIWFDLGIAYQRQGEREAAKGAYQRAHDLDPSNAAYLQALTEIQ